MVAVVRRSSAQSRAVGALLALAVAWCWPERAPAQVPLAVKALGDCPSAERVRASLTRRQIPAEAAGSTLTLRAVAGGAELTLTNAASTVVVERHIDSADCSALADAAALIAEAYFVGLKTRASEAPTASASASSAPVTMPEITTAPPEQKSAAPEVLPPPTATAPFDAPPRASEPASPSHLVLSLTGGADLVLGSWSALGQVGAGYFYSEPALALELHALAGSATTVDTDQDRVRRFEGRAALRVLKQFGSLPLMPWAGAGASRTELRLLDLKNPPTRTHWSPLFEAGILLDQPLAGALSLRAELGCRVLSLQEEYVLNPGNETIGEGPRAACSLLAGLGFSFFREP